MLFRMVMIFKIYRLLKKIFSIRYEKFSFKLLGNKILGIFIYLDRILLLLFVDFLEF